MGKSTQTDIGYLFRNGEETREIIRIKDENRQRGSYVVGLTGMGKSGFYQTVVKQDIAKEHPIIVIDPHGGLVDQIIAQLPNDEEVLQRVFLLDLTDEDYPFALNIFTCADPSSSKERTSTRNRVLRVFEKIWPEVTNSVLFRKIMPNVVETLIDNQGMVIGDIPDLLHNAEYRKTKTRNLHNRHVRNFWQSEYKEKDAEVLDNRLRDFLIDPVIEHITCHPNGSIDLRRAIEEKQIILVKLPTELKEYERSAPVIGTILLSLITGTIFSFEDTEWNKRPGVSLFVDEVENFITDDFDTIYNQARKYRARLSIANQHLYQLPQTMQKAAIGTDSVIAFKVDKDDARDMAPVFFDQNAQPKPDPIYREVVKYLPNYQNKNDRGYRAVKHFYENYIKVMQREYKREPVKDKTGFEFPIDYYFGYDLAPTMHGTKEDVRLDIEHTLRFIDLFLYDAQVNGKVDGHYLDVVMKYASQLFGFIGYSMFHSDENSRKYLRGDQSIEDTLSWTREELAKTQQEFDEQIAAREQKIQVFESFLAGDAFYLYLNEYYTHFYTQQNKSLSHEFVRETQLLSDAVFWQKIVASIRVEKNIGSFISSAKKYLQSQANAYVKLAERSTVAKIIQQEIDRMDKSKIRENARSWVISSLKSQYYRENSDNARRESEAYEKIKEIYRTKRYSRHSFSHWPPESTYSSSRIAFYEKQDRFHRNEWQPTARSQWSMSMTYEEVVSEGLFSMKTRPLSITMDNLALVLQGLIYGSSAYNEVKEAWEEAAVLCQTVRNFSSEYPNKETFVQKHQSLYQELFAKEIDRSLDKEREKLSKDHAILAEAERNAALCKLDTMGKVEECRKAELKEYIASLRKEVEILSTQRAKKIASKEEWFDQARKSHEKEKTHYDTFMESLVNATNALIAHPIGDERTYKESDVAYALQKLPARHVMVKIAGEKQDDPPRILQLKTLDAPQAIAHGERLETRIGRIRDQTRKKYCRPVAEVEACLRGDYQELGQTSSSPASKRQTRKLDSTELPDNLPEEERPARRKRLTHEDPAI